MEKLKIAVNYNNSTDIGGGSLKEDCHKFALLHKLDPFKFKLI